LESDFSKTNCQWFALEMNGPDELLVLCARLDLSPEEKTALILPHSLLESSVSKALLIEYFILQFQEMCLNMSVENLVIEIPMSENSIISILEREGYADSGGNFLDKSKEMLVKFSKRLRKDDNVLEALEISEIIDGLHLTGTNPVDQNNDIQQQGDPMVSLMQDLFAALHKSTEFEK
jgi:hypothetical protein